MHINMLKNEEIFSLLLRSEILATIKIIVS